MSQFIEFSVPDPTRFLALKKAFAEFKRDKDADNWRTTDELIAIFDAEALSHFYWPATDERLQRLEDLRTRPIIITPTEDTTNSIWDFDSLVDAFINGEYQLLSCDMVDTTRARWNFYSWSYPYGGVGCMVAVIEAFGFPVTGIEDGTGFISFERQE